MFAFLAARLGPARIDIERDYAPARFEGPDHGWATVEGKETAFCIVTDPRTLRGRRLTGYALVSSARELVAYRRLELVAIAESRLVNAQP